MIKSARGRRLERKPFPGARMAEAKRQRVEVEPRRTLAAVLLVADHWMPGLGKVDAYLVLPSGLELHLDESSARLGGQPAPLRAGVAR